MLTDMAGILDLETFSRARLALRVSVPVLERLAALDRLASWLADDGALRWAATGTMALSGIYHLRVLSQEFEIAPQDTPAGSDEAEQLARALTASLPEGRLAGHDMRYEDEHGVWAFEIEFRGTEIDAMTVRLHIDREALRLGAVSGYGMPLDFSLGQPWRVPFARAEEILARLLQGAANSRSALIYESLRELQVTYPDAVASAMRQIVPGLLGAQTSDMLALVRQLSSGYASARYFGLEAERYPIDYALPGDREQDAFARWLQEESMPLIDYHGGTPGVLPWPGRE